MLFMRALTIVCLGALLSACGGGSSSSSVAPSEPPPPSTEDLRYRVNLPEGKLYWPHHAPTLDEAGYQQLLDTLWITNNFPLYQGGDTPDSIYLHDGLDLVLKNGTPIYSLANGKVVHSGSAGNGDWLVIEDEQGDGWAWAYIHVARINVRVGDTVKKGQRLCQVQFSGLEHLHLSRIKAVPGKNWSEQYASIDPAPFFVFNDRDPPQIKTPFYYFRNNSDDVLSVGEANVIHGAVDIVAGIKDQGHYANPGPVQWPTQRLAPSQIAYQIIDANGNVRSQSEINFSRTQVQWGDAKLSQAQALFKWIGYLDNEPQYKSGWSYYALSHLRDDINDVRQLSASDLFWDTRSLDAAGLPKFPNGRYQIRVTVTDHKGLSASASDFVYVVN